MTDAPAPVSEPASPRARVAVDAPADPANRPRRAVLSSLPPWVWSLVALVILWTYTAIREPAFLGLRNQINILNQNAIIGTIAVGMTIVIVLGGIDLSVGSLLAFAGVVGLVTLNAVVDSGGGEWLAVLAGVAVIVAIATVGGWLNGMLIAKGRLAPFIATLGALLAYRSAAQWIASGSQVTARSYEVLPMLSRGVPIPGTNAAPPGRPPMPLEFPYAVLAMLGVAAAGWVFLNLTRSGRYVVAIGCNERAAVYSAINVDRVKVLAYTLLGLATGVGGVLWAARYGSVSSSNAAILLELDVIAAVVIGGTLMSGGVGSIIGTIVGVMLLGVINNMMAMLQIGSHPQNLVKGVIIILAVLVQRLGRR